MLRRLAPLALLCLTACASPTLPGVPPVPRWVDGRVIVRFRDGADPHRVEQARVRIGARTWERLPMAGADLLRLDGSLDVPRALEALSDYDDVVEFAEPDFLFEPEGAPSDYDGDLLWGLAKIDAPNAWATTEGSRGVVVAVLDSGIDVEHRDLADNVWRNDAESIDGRDDDGDGFVDDVHGWDFVDRRPDPRDATGHGTAVAGVIGAVGGNGGIVGVSPRVALMALRVMGPDGVAASDAIRAIDFARAHGASVVNASWGSRGYSNALFECMRAAGDEGILVVAAAGNGDSNGLGIDLDTAPVYPAAFHLENVIAVAASDERDRLAPFSNFGAETVALAAPGVSIVSAAPGGQYGRFDGTSMSAAYVSGVAALVRADYPQLPLSELVDVLVETADPSSALAGRLHGRGRLDAGEAMRGADDAVYHRPPA